MWLTRWKAIIATSNVFQMLCLLLRWEFSEGKGEGTKKGKGEGGKLSGAQLACLVILSKNGQYRPHCLCDDKLTYYITAFLELGYSFNVQ